MNTANLIEAQYRELVALVGDIEAAQEYAPLYASIHDELMRSIFAMLHYEFTELFGMMNQRLPTTEEGAHFWAEPSRLLIKAIEITMKLYERLAGTPEAFSIDEYYLALITRCRSFLHMYQGTPLPANMEKVEPYYKIPISIASQVSPSVATPAIKRIDREYIQAWQSEPWRI